MVRSKIGRCSPLPRLTSGALRDEPLAERPSKISLANQGRPGQGEPWFADWLDSLPRVLGADALRRLCDAVVRAAGAGRPVVAALGGHVVKTGCGAYLVDWINRGILTGLALNGSAAIHDLELAIAGKTSEDVGSRLMAGTFGFARETSDLFASACKRGLVRFDRAGNSPRRSHPQARWSRPRFLAPGSRPPRQGSTDRPRRHRH